MRREEPDEAPWRRQAAWTREMAPPTKFDYVMGGIVFLIYLPLYAIMAPRRWWLERKER